MANRLKWIKGNKLRLIIPMQRVEFTKEGKVTEDYIPPVGTVLTVELQGAYRKYTFEPLVEDNTLVFEDNGTINVGDYAVVIYASEPDGTKRRSKWKEIVSIYDDNAPVVKEFDDFPDYAEGQVIEGSVFYKLEVEQLQSDWAQTDEEAKDYIKNKPTIPTVPTNVSAFVNDAGYLTEDSAYCQGLERDITTCKTDITTCKTDIDTLEDGRTAVNLFTGVLTGEGWGSSNDWHLGVEIHPIVMKDGRLISVTPGDSWIVSPLVRVEAGRRYTLSFDSYGGSCEVYIWGASNVPLGRWVVTGYRPTITFSAPSGDLRIFIQYRNTFAYPQLELGDKSTEFHAPALEVLKNIPLADNLVNYYLKSETYTSAEVDALVAKVKQFTYLCVDSLPVPSAATMWKIYLVPSVDPQTQNAKDEFITIEDNGTYRFEQIGSTAISISSIPNSKIDTLFA